MEWFTLRFMGLGRRINELIFGKAPETVAQTAVSALNARQWDEYRRLLSPDFYYRDGDDQRLDGADAFIAALEAMLSDAPDFELQIEEYQPAGNIVMMRGRTVSAKPRFCSLSVWRVQVKGGLIHCWHNYRANDTIRLLAYARTRS